MGQELDYDLLKETIFKELGSFLKKMEGIGKENGNLFFVEMVLNYVEGILVNFFGRLYEKGEKELSDDEIKDIIKDNLKKIENNVIETLISFRQLKNRSQFINKEHSV